MFSIQCEIFIFSEFSTVLLGKAQLSPVYKPFGGDNDGQKSPVEKRKLEAPAKAGKAIDHGRTKFVTKTVYGFLDFTTTVDKSTIMIFSPKSGNVF